MTAQISKICIVCDSEFLSPVNLRGIKKYCGAKCRNKAANRRSRENKLNAIGSEASAERRGQTVVAYSSELLQYFVDALREDEGLWPIGDIKMGFDRGKVAYYVTVVPYDEFMSEGR